jgi:hypothetical protein
VKKGEPVSASNVNVLAVMAQLAELEASAASITQYENVVPPGVLQTEEHARAIISSAWPAMSAAAVEDLVQLRLRRAAQFAAFAPRACFFLDEAVIARLAGGPEASRRQLRHLTSFTTLPFVTIMAVPFSAGTHAGLSGPFKVITVQDGSTAIYLEDRDGGIITTELEAVAEYRERSEQLRRVAISWPGGLIKACEGCDERSDEQ